MIVKFTDQYAEINSPFFVTKIDIILVVWFLSYCVV